jgi:hypothetical protein
MILICKQYFTHAIFDVVALMQLSFEAIYLMSVILRSVIR